MAFDYSQFSGTTYPASPIAAISQAMLRAWLFHRAQRDQEQTLAEERRQRQQGELYNRYNLLTSVAQKYVQAGQQPPQEVLLALSEAQRQLTGAGLSSDLVTQTKQTPPGRGFGPGSETMQSRMLVYPGAQQLAYETLGEMAQAFGYQLRPNVKPDLKIRDLLRQMPESAIMDLFIRPEQQQQQTREEAMRRLAALKDYPPQQIFSPQFPAQLREQFLKDYQTVHGIPYPTEQRQVREPVTIGQQRVQEGGLNRFLTPPGQQQIQVPTGRTEAIPILPQTAPDFVVDIPGVGRVPFSQLPSGAQTALINRIFESKEKVEVTLSDGKRVKVSPEKALELDLRRDSMVTFIDPVTKAKVTVPATSLPSFFPRKSPGGGGGGATETQARIKASLMQRYLAGDNLNEREQRVLFGATGEEIIPARDRKILELWRQNLDPLTNEPRDANLAERLKPDVDRIVNQMVTPTTRPTGQQTITMAELNEIARAEGKPIAAVVAAARQQGYTIIGQAPSVPRPAPRPTVTTDISNIIHATAGALKRQGVNWTVARLRILRELAKRGVNVGDLNVIKAVDQVRY